MGKGRRGTLMGRRRDQRGGGGGRRRPTPTQTPPGSVEVGAQEKQASSLFLISGRFLDLGAKSFGSWFLAARGRDTERGWEVAPPEIVREGDVEVWFLGFLENSAWSVRFLVST